MSWWDRYLAPGDLRTRQQQGSISAPAISAGATDDDGTPNAITPSTSSVYDVKQPLTPAHRHRRQNALFLGGLTFTVLSLSLTRRTILRKRLASYPSTFTPSHFHISPPPNAQQEVGKVEGSLLAIEALGLATLNVCSVFMAGIGGAMVWWDVAGVEELRGRVQMKGIGSEGMVDLEAEKELGEWVAGAFGRVAPGQEEGEGNTGVTHDAPKIGGDGILGEAFRQGEATKMDEHARARAKDG